MLQEIHSFCFTLSRFIACDICMLLCSSQICLIYRKVPEFSDARKLCCNLPKIQTKRPNLRVFCQKDANGIANSEDPDQTTPLGAVLIWVCTVCQDLSVQKLWIITV